MNRHTWSAALFLFVLTSEPAYSELKPGYIPSTAWMRLAPHVSTQQDVLDLFGPPYDKVEVKAEKFLRYVTGRNADRLKPCFPGGNERVTLWQYRHVNAHEGEKYFYNDDIRSSREYSYIAFHNDGRVCGVVPSNEDF